MAYRPAYYQANRDEINARRRAWIAANPGANAAYCRQWRERQKARAAAETATACERCGIQFDRARRIRGTIRCRDCGKAGGA